MDPLGSRAPPETVSQIKVETAEPSHPKDVFDELNWSK
jgi:hypothetical protein